MRCGTHEPSCRSTDLKGRKGSAGEHCPTAPDAPAAPAGASRRLYLKGEAGKGRRA